MADAPAPTTEPAAEAATEPLKYKTWVLRVSIHCEGCKRKVKRILLGIEGVYTINVDAKAHKVVVSGDIEAETLIKKLEKSGKHAELWTEPEPQEQNKKKKKKSKNKKAAPGDSPAASEEERPEAENNGQPPGERVEVVYTRGGGVDPGKIPENSQGNQPPPAPQEANEDEGPAENNGNGGGGGGGGKRRKKKGRKKSNNTNNGSQPPNQQGPVGEPPGNNHGDAPLNSQPPPPPQQYQGPGGAPVPVNHYNPHPNYGYNCPPPPPGYHPPPQQQPIQAAVGYNTAYPPSNSYAGAYYAAPPPYVRRCDDGGGGRGGVLYEPGYGYGSCGLLASQRPSDTFEIFSDENPNACSVM